MSSPISFHGNNVRAICTSGLRGAGSSLSIIRQACQQMEGKKMAVLVGCNYPNTRNELHGCINDVVAMRKMLLDRFGFDHVNIELLTDEPGSQVLPTGANIKAALDRMVERAKGGDVLYFHYSGHGTRIPSVKHYQPFRHDEAIVPCDFNLITDVDFRELVNRVPKGASFTMISDSCHSGHLIDKEKEQIGPLSAHKHSNEEEASAAGRSRSLPLDSLLHHLSLLTNINSADIGTHMLELFDELASLRFRVPVEELFEYMESFKTDSGILLSGCQADETSADINPTAQGGQAYGAFSNAVQMVLKSHLGPLSNRELVMKVREVLHDQHFQQHPCLYCSDKNTGTPFLWQTGN